MLEVARYMLHILLAFKVSVKTNIKVKVVAWNNDPTTPSDS